MATLHDRDRDISDYRERDRSTDDREISLGTGTILGIFFALALLCAVFFGIGYSSGRKSVQTAITAATPQPANSGGIFSNFKPSAGSPIGSSVQAEAPRDPDGQIVTNPVTPSEEAPPTKAALVTSRSSSTKPPMDTAPAPMPTVDPNGTTMVQVAAVSHQEDADTLVTALKKKGYGVFIRKETQDRLLHVQVGPFATHKEGDVMRQHLLADGYNAIVK
jgi:DedD protein